MPFTTRPVSIDFADTAAGILREAWPPPALDYSPEYVRWQLGYPSASGQAPAVAAFDDTIPVGFAAVTPRGIGWGSHHWQSGIVSFVSVRPEWQKKGIAAALYSALLEKISAAGMLVVTFAAADSPGEKTLLRSYEQAGFRIHPLGRYPVYGAVIRPGELSPEWSWESCRGGLSEVAPVFENCLQNRRVLWGTPDDAEIRHGMSHPHGRRLLVLRREGEPVAVAWVVR